MAFSKGPLHDTLFCFTHPKIPMAYVQLSTNIGQTDDNDDDDKTNS